MAASNASPAAGRPQSAMQIEYSKLRAHQILGWSHWNNSERSRIRHAVIAMWEVLSPQEQAGVERP